MAGRTAPEPIRPFSLDFSPLRAFRERNGITRRELAIAAGVHDITIWRLESGRFKNPSLMQVVAIARSLSVPIHELFIVTEPRGE